MYRTHKLAYATSEESVSSKSEVAATSLRHEEAKAEEFTKLSQDDLKS